MKRAGFTLVELMVVTVIIALLASVGFISYQAVNKQARDGRRNTDLESIRIAAESYRNDCGAYPTQMPWGSQLLGGPTTSPCYNKVYMEKIPQDPRAALYKYAYVYGSTNKYTLCSAYEVLPSSAPQATLNTNCGTSACSATGQTNSCKYSVTNP